MQNASSMEKSLGYIPKSTAWSTATQKRFFPTWLQTCA